MKIILFCYNLCSHALYNAVYIMIINPSIFSQGLTNLRLICLKTSVARNDDSTEELKYGTIVTGQYMHGWLVGWLSTETVCSIV